jgi:pyridoxamine 5'-phosphate oxidase
MTVISNNPLLDGLDEKVIDRDPIKQFQIWFNDAIAAQLPMPDAMTLATATPDGKPSARMVLLKQVDHDGFVFYTNYHSAKASQLDANPYAALVFYWAQLDRQVRVEGSVTRTSPEESRDYFRTRPRESQIGAWASEQSETIAGREVLEQRSLELETQYCKSRIGRLHDRILYQRTADSWTISRLAP